MTSPLIDAADLAARLGEVSVLDVRYRMGGPPGEAEHAAGHLPGAAYVDLDSDLADPPADPVDDRGRHPLPDPDRFGAAMRRAGVSHARPVVVYDDWQGRAAARAWWLLRHHGHREVRVLDGGWTAWQQAGGPVQTGPAAPPAGDFVPTAGQLAVVAADDLGDATVLVDARDPGRFRGETEPVDPVAGHVPGAVNVPTGANLRDDGRFRKSSDLRALYAGAGVVPGAVVATSCGSGITACHDLLALEVAGVRAALYPGSWSGWVSDSSRPIATG